MATHVELYEALKPSIGEAAAAMIAEVVPPAGDLATKADVLALGVGLADIRGEVRGIRWVLGILVPMVVGVWGTLVAVLLKI